MQAGRDADAGGVEAVVQVCGDRLRDGAAGGGDLSGVETEAEGLGEKVEVAVDVQEVTGPAGSRGSVAVTPSGRRQVGRARTPEPYG